MKDRLALPAVGLVSFLVLFSVGVSLVGRQMTTLGGYTVSSLPTVNAFLNGTSTVLLTIGYFMIRGKKVTTHKFWMLSAFGVSSLFLISYLIYHYRIGSMPFGGQGWVRSVYFVILISHIILAALIVPLALVTLSLALRGRVQKHVRLARWTLPLWLYVSATGVVVYIMLYHLYPSP